MINEWSHKLFGQAVVDLLRQEKLMHNFKGLEIYV